MQLIDLLHLGRPHVIGAWLVDDEVLVDPGPATCIDMLLEALGDTQPKVIALTHIHFDHAGATGSLLQRWPSTEVWVHERGARHLASPERLWSSAQRLYGDRMDELWGEMIPVPEESITVVGDEDRGAFTIAQTPGHASHHVSYLHRDTGTAFTGDVGGVRLPGGPTQAPTPPPDIDLALWEQSLQTIEAWNPSTIAPTHFGSYDDVEATLAGVRDWLAEWATPQARELGPEEWTRRQVAWIREEAADEDTALAMMQAAPPEQCRLGLERAWSLQD